MIIKLWVCSSGEYSDRKNMCVYTSEEDARRVSSARGWNEPQPLDLDPAIPPEIASGLTFFSLAMVKDTGRVMYGPYPTDQWECERKDHRYNRHGFGVCWGFYCWARDADHAVKIAADRRRQLLAENRELPD